MICSKVIRTILVLSVTAGLYSCGGSKDAFDEIQGESGFSSAVVWLDTDGDFLKDEDEPETRTSESGSFSIKLSEGSGAEDSLVVAEVLSGETRTADGQTAEHSFLLAAYADSGCISVWTTLQYSLMSDGQAEREDALSEIITQFSLPSDFSVCPVQNEGYHVLEYIVQTAFAQEYEKNGDSGLPAHAALVSAGIKAVTSAAGLLGIHDEHTQNQKPPMASAPSEASDDIFYGDFARIPSDANMNFGTGLSESSYQLMSGALCVDYSDIVNKGLCSNSISYTFSLIKSVHELNRHFSVRASAKAGVHVGHFDVVSASGGFNFLKETSFADNSLYILLSTERQVCNYNINALLVDSMNILYKTDYEDFRTSCGDRFLSSLTTGGYFHAFIEIKLDSSTSRQEAELDLSAKVLGVKVYDHTWRDVISDIDRDYEINTRVVSNFFTYSDNYIKNAQGIFYLYDAFAEKMRSLDCDGENGWQNCSYTANFAPYERIVDASAGNIDSFKIRLAYMKDYENYYFYATDVIDRISDITLQPQNYDISDDDDWNLDKLNYFKNALDTDRTRAIVEWGYCQSDIDYCEDPSGKYFVTISKIVLPPHKFRLPETCAEVEKVYPGKGDGYYTLYIGGSYDKYYDAYCADMATAKPKTYIPLHNVSGNKDAPSYNYSSYLYKTFFNEGASYQTYSYLLVEPVPLGLADQGDLRIISPQDDFKETAAVPEPDSNTMNFLDTVSLSVLEAKSDSEKYAGANLNIEGTNFKIIALIIQDSSPLVNLSADGKNLDISVKYGTAKPVQEVLLKWGER